MNKEFTHMATAAHHRPSRLLRFFMALLLGLSLSAPASAQEIESCKPETIEAMRAASEARLAYALAVIDQIYEQDDSVLALTCFNQAVGMAAQSTGNIFSGDYSATINNVVPQTLWAWYENFHHANAPAGSITTRPPLGFTSGTVDYANTAIPPVGGMNCPAIDDLWDYINTNGVNTQAPYLGLDEIANGAPPTGAGAEFLESWNSPTSQPYFTNLADAANAVETSRGTPPTSGRGPNSISFACVPSNYWTPSTTKDRSLRSAGTR